MSIYLTALVRSKKGHVQDLQPLLLTLLSASRKEEGCQHYNLHQSMDDENLFIFQEVWKDQASLDFHNQQIYLINFAKASKPFIEGDVTLYKTNVVA